MLSIHHMHSYILACAWLEHVHDFIWACAHLHLSICTPFNEYLSMSVEHVHAFTFTWTCSHFQLNMCFTWSWAIALVSHFMSMCLLCSIVFLLISLLLFSTFVLSVVAYCTLCCFVLLAPAYASVAIHIGCSHVHADVTVILNIWSVAVHPKFSLLSSHLDHFDSSGVRQAIYFITSDNISFCF